MKDILNERIYFKAAEKLFNAFYEKGVPGLLEEIGKNYYLSENTKGIDEFTHELTKTTTSYGLKNQTKIFNDTFNKFDRKEYHIASWVNHLQRLSEKEEVPEWFEIFEKYYEYTYREFIVQIEKSLEPVPKPKPKKRGRPKGS